MEMCFLLKLSYRFLKSFVCLLMLCYPNSANATLLIARHRGAVLHSIPCICCLLDMQGIEWKCISYIYLVVSLDEVQQRGLFTWQVLY